MSTIAHGRWRQEHHGSTGALRRRRRLAVERLEAKQLLAADLFVAGGGDDFRGLGTATRPYQTLERALDAAQPGDTINLRGGTYGGGITVMKPGITIQSAPGEWAVIAGPTDDPGYPFGLRFYPDSAGCTVRNLEIQGGYWYAVKTETAYDWGRPTKYGTSSLTIEGCRLHDSGVDVVKLVAGSDDVVIRRNEIFNSGVRTGESADGIDATNADRLLVEDNSIHDIAANGILTCGGGIGDVIRRNHVADTRQAGIDVGFTSDMPSMDTDTRHPECYANPLNPQLFQSIDAMVRDNVIVHPGMAGVGIYAALRPVVAGNTILDAASQAQASILFAPVDVWVPAVAAAYAAAQVGPYPHTPLPGGAAATPAAIRALPAGGGTLHTATVGATVQDNIVTAAAGNPARMVDIRNGSLLGPQSIDGNRYDARGPRGALFIDRSGGDAAPEEAFRQWQSQQGYDLHGSLGDPELVKPGSTTPARPATFGATTFQWSGSPRRPAAHAPESAGSVTLFVERTGDLSAAASVDYTTVDGTAVAGPDYTATAGTLSFAAGQAKLAVTVPLVVDTDVEGDEVLRVRLVNPRGANPLGCRIAVADVIDVTIDEDRAPTPTNWRTTFVSPAGSDATGDGSAVRPWATLQKAADTALPGDYVIVAAGRYQGCNVTASGRPDARITFHADPGVSIVAPNAVTGDGINLEGASFVTVEGFSIADMPRAGIRSVSNTGVEIRGNVLDHNMMWGILTGFSDAVVIENNTASRTQQQHGIYVGNSGDRPVIRGNVVTGNRDCGIHVNADAHAGGDGIITGAVIEGNVVRDNGLGGGAGINLDGVQDAVIRNNLLADNHAAGIALFWTDGREASQRNLVANNTVVQAADGRWAVLVGGGSVDNTLVNNVLVHRNPARGGISVDAASLPGFTSDWNVTDGRFTTNGWSVIGTTAWQAATGQDRHSRTAPLPGLFVNATAGDYRLAAASPAIGAGDPARMPVTDVFAHPRAGRCDAGACQAVAAATATVQFSAADWVVYDASGMAVVGVDRGGDTSGTTTVAFSTADGTAAAGREYTAAAGLLTFAPGETHKEFRVFVGHAAAVRHETIGLVLAQPTGGAIGSRGAATLHLVTDIPTAPGSFEFAAAVTYATEGVDAAATITVRRTGGSAGTASVAYATAAFQPPPKVTWYAPHWLQRHTISPVAGDGTAVAGVDYLATSGTLTFLPGEVVKTFRVPVLADPAADPEQAVTLRLTAPTGGATLGTLATSSLALKPMPAALAAAFAGTAATPTGTAAAPTATTAAFATYASAVAGMTTTGPVATGSTAKPKTA